MNFKNIGPEWNPSTIFVNIWNINYPNMVIQTLKGIAKPTNCNTCDNIAMTDIF